MIISLLNQKGGVGKTTLAVNLARYYTLMGQKILLVDSDMQGSAYTWHAKNNGELLDMVCLYKPTIDKDVLKFRDSYDKIFIDGVPQVSEMLISTLKCSDVVLIPVTPSPYDIWATKDVVDYVKERQQLKDGKPKSAFIISRRIINTRIGEGCIRTLQRYDLPIFEFGTYQRVIYAESIEYGLSVVEHVKTEHTDSYHPATKEIINIATELEEFIYGIN